MSAAIDNVSIAGPEPTMGPAQPADSTQSKAPLALAAAGGTPLQALAINDVLKYDGKFVRLIAASPLKNIVYLIEVDGDGTQGDSSKVKTALPFVDSFRHVRANGVRIEDLSWRRPLSPSAAEQAVGEARFERIKALVKDPAILDARTRGPLLTKHAAIVGVSKKTLLADLRAWWQRGQVKDALVGKFHRCGRVTDTTTGAIIIDEKSVEGIKHVVLAPVREKARGRRPLNANYTPMNLTAKEKAQILKVGKEKYLQDATVSMRSVVAHVINELYAVKAANGTPARDAEGNAVLPPMGWRPTHRQISYLLRIALPASKTYMRRHGTADFLNNKAGTTGTVLDDCIGPGDVYECDDTTFDYHCSSEDDISVILGKPILHIVVDRYTRLIVGFHLSLDATCWEDAKLALLSVCNDWKAECAKHGIAYFPEDFPAQGVICNRYFSDRGSMMTNASDDMTNAGNDATNAPAKLSRSKAIVEGTFGRFIKLLKEVPGFEPQWNVSKRRRKPYEAAACLNRTQLEAIVLRIIITLNREILKDYPQGPADSAKGLLPIPRELWARETERMNALPRRVSREWLRSTLLSKDVATVTQDGILFMGNYYTCKEAVQQDWFSIASIGSPFEVAVRFTPKNLDEITVQDPKRKDVHYVAQLTSKSLRITGNTSGLTDTSSNAMAAQKRNIRREAEPHNMALRVGFLQDVSKVVAPAQASMLAATKGKSLASRKANNAECREAEADRHRKASHRVSSDAPATSTLFIPPAVAPLTPNVVTDDILNSFSDPSLMNDFLASLETA